MHRIQHVSKLEGVTQALFGGKRTEDASKEGAGKRSSADVRGKSSVE